MLGCVYLSNTTNGGMYNLLHKELLHVSAFFFGHLQVGIELNFSKRLYLNYLGIYKVFRERHLACCVGVVVWVHENSIF